MRRWLAAVEELNRCLAVNWIVWHASPCLDGLRVFGGIRQRSCMRCCQGERAMLHLGQAIGSKLEVRCLKRMCGLILVALLSALLFVQC